MNKQKQTFEGKMDLTFVKENVRWYIDLRQFLEASAGSKDDLEMVAGRIPSAMNYPTEVTASR